MWETISFATCDGGDVGDSGDAGDSGDSVDGGLGFGDSVDGGGNDVYAEEIDERKGIKLHVSDSTQTLNIEYF